MQIRTQGEGGIQGIEWVAGTVGALLFISTGLELVAHQVFGQTDVDTLIWALYVGFWTYVLSIISFIILSVQWLADWRRVRVNRALQSPRAASIQDPLGEWQSARHK
jgi:hypothetical protein